MVTETGCRRSAHTLMEITVPPDTVRVPPATSVTTRRNLCRISVQGLQGRNCGEDFRGVAS